MSRLLQCYDARRSSPLLWIDAQDDAAEVLCDGRPPWSDTASALAHLNRVQGLIGSDVIVLPVNPIVATWLQSAPSLRDAMAARTRRLSPLKTLLDDGALRSHLNQIAHGLRARHRDRPVVLAMPSPRYWPALAYAQAFGNAAALDVQADDADAASVYVADFLRSFGDTDIDGLLLQESTRSVASGDDDLACYGAVINVARHYRWALALQQPHADGYGAAPIDLLLTPQPQRGAARELRSVALDDASASTACHLRVPAHGFSPERVLEQLAALRH